MSLAHGVRFWILSSVEDVEVEVLLHCAVRSVNEVLMSLLECGDAKDLLNRCGGNWMVEVLVFVKPLNTKIMLARVLKRLVDGADVFAAAHGRDPIVSRIIHWIVEQAEASWVPSLSDLRIEVISAVQIGIDSCKNGSVDLFILRLESVMEHNLQVGVVAEIVRVIGRRGGAIQGDVLEGQGG